MRRFQMISLVLFLGALAGCGWGETLGVGVSGAVTYKGQPIKEGTIAFIPMSGTNGPSGGGNIDDGKYAIPRKAGLAPGKYRVEIRAFEETGKETAKSTQQSQMFGRPIDQRPGSDRNGRSGTPAPGAEPSFARRCLRILL